MNIKHRALSLLLSLAIVLTFMPALAFAAPLPDDIGSSEWSITNEKTDFFMEGSSQTIQVTTTLDGTGAELSYQWYVGDDSDSGMNWTAIDGETGSSYVAKSQGFYACAITWNGERRVKPFWVLKENDGGEDTGDDDEDEEYESDIYIINDGQPFYLEGGRAEMSCYAGPGDKAPFEYKWYKKADSDNWQLLEGETTSKCSVSAAGEYKCVVTSGESSANGYFSVYNWKITNSERVVYFEYGSSAKLTVETNYSGSDISYQWYFTRYNAETDSEEYIKIDGATGPSYEPGTNVDGEFHCDVTMDGERHVGWYYVEIYTDDYTDAAVYQDATASYSTPDNRDLTIDFTSDYPSINFPEAGDKITIDNGTTSEVYTFTRYPDDAWFVSENNEILIFDYDLFGPAIDVENEKLNVHVFSAEEEYDHANKKIVRKYDTELTLPVKINTNIESISFEPGNITLNGEDIKWVDESGTVHDDVFSFGRRTYHKDGEGEWYDCYADGDKITVTYTDKPSKTYVYNYKANGFQYQDGEHWQGLFYPSVEDEYLKAGENNVKIWYRGAYCTVKVTVNTNGHVHSWDNGTVETAPTCTSAGEKIYRCSCGETKTESIVAIGHDWGDPVWTWAADYSTASAKFLCKHDSSHAESVNATVTNIAADGKKIYTATLTFNGKEYSDTKEVADQSQGGGEVTPTPVNPDPTPAPTPAPTPIPAPAPVTAGAADGTVAAIPDGSTVKVTSNAAGTVAYTKAKNAKSVTVPATVSLNGKKYSVTEVSANAFKGTKATTVTIGKNVKTLKAKAFNGSKVTTLTVKSKSLTKKSVKGSLKGSGVRTVKVKVGNKADNKKFVNSYKKLFTKKIVGAKVTVK